MSLLGKIFKKNNTASNISTVCLPSNPKPSEAPKLTSNQNFDLFDKIAESSILQYEYEQNLCTKGFENALENISCAGETLEFKQEPNNEYDDKAVAIYYNNLKIGYVFKGNIQDMINDWISRNDYFCSYINKVDLISYKITYKIAFYKPMSKLKSITFSLSKTSKKIDEYTKRIDNLECCNENEPVTFEKDYDTDSFFVYNSQYEEIGELSAATVEKLENKIDNCNIEELPAIISSLDETDSGSLKCIICAFY